MRRLHCEGVRLKREKCSFLQTSVIYLGYKIDAEGIHATDNKVKAILKAPTPKNVSELRAFLGMLNYYGKFLSNLSTLVHPLNELLKTGHRWEWRPDCDKAFQEAKRQLSEAPVLVHYDPVLPIRLAGDASSYGLGAVLSHVFPDGTEHPIAFASRTLQPSELNYAQVEKEALSLVFGLRKFHRYIYGRKFTLVTDHKPLTAILGPKNVVPPLAAARLQRWALLLASHTYDIEYRPTQNHSNADGLSRLPIPSRLEERKSTDVNIFNIAQMQALPVTFFQLKEATQSDPILGKVLQYEMLSWPSAVSEQLKPFWNRRGELNLEEGCILWGTRVVVPESLRSEVLSMLHETHVGIVRMKQLARNLVWWPGLDKALELTVKTCGACQQHQNTPPIAPLHPWLWPNKPWSRIHIDFAGPFQGRHFLIAVDTHSKWPEVREMSTTTAAKTIIVLREMFANNGLPDQIVSDNGPQFTSYDFQHFCKANGIKHIRTAPYHPSSNGLAERFVQTFKQAMRKAEKDPLLFSHKLASFLLTYRATPHATTNVAPCILFMGRPLRTRLDCMKPDVESTVTRNQTAQKLHHDGGCKERTLQLGQAVMVRDFLGREKWVAAVVVQQLGPVSYLLQLPNGTQWRRHVDHVRSVLDVQLRSESRDTVGQKGRRRQVEEEELGTGCLERETDELDFTTDSDRVLNGMPDQGAENVPGNLPDVSGKENTRELGGSSVDGTEPSLPFTPESFSNQNPEDALEPRRNPTRVRMPPKRFRDD